MTAPVAELRSVSKSFGATRALENLSLGVEPGEIVALLGPNGAGKSTALNVLMGLRRPDAGKALLFGEDPTSPEGRLSVGVTPQETALPENLKVREIVDLVRAHYSFPLSTNEVLGRFDLSNLGDRQAGGLSGGQKRRLVVALSFAGNPRAVFLDEPTTGLDPSARRTLWESAQSFVDDGGTLLLTTHYLEEAEALASRIILIDHGRVVREGSVADIKNSVGIRVIRFRAREAPELPGIVRREVEGDEAEALYTFHVSDSDQAVRALIESGKPFSELDVMPVSLEEAVFVSKERL